MKKVVATLIAVLLSGASVFAQNFYFRAGLGYGFAQAGQSLDASGTPYNGSISSSNTYSIKSASFSAGFQSQIGFGYMFNDNVGVQLDANLGIAPKKYTLNATGVNIGGVPSDVTVQTQASSPVFLLPSLVLQSRGDKLNVYGRFGLALPLDTKITQDQIITNQPGTGAITSDDFTFDITTGFSLGFAGAAGVKYNLNDRVSLWGELTMMSMSVYIKKQELTAVSENGQSVPTSAVSGNLVTNYSKNVTADSTGANQPAYTLPFSNVGVHFGVLVNLGHHSNRSHRDEVSEPGRPYRRR